MQAAKDSFLMTLTERLVQVNPQRTMTIDGVTRPAIFAMENEVALPPETVTDAFRLQWQDARRALPFDRLMYMDCAISYSSQGTDAMMRTDRGRMVTAMSSELLQTCSGRSAAKCDYTQTPAADLGSNIFWSYPLMGTPRETDGVLEQTATVRVYFFPEAA